MAKRSIQRTSVSRASQDKVVAASYRKHQAVDTWDKRAIRRTKRGFARFKKGLPKTDKEYAMMYSHKDAHAIPISGKSDASFFWLDLGYTVGASSGEETTYILIKVNAVRPGVREAHARPVTEHELRQTFKVQMP